MTAETSEPSARGRWLPRVALAVGVLGLLAVFVLLRTAVATDYLYHSVVKDPERVAPAGPVLVAPADGTCTGTVEVVEYLGADLMVYVECEGLGLMTVRAAGDGTVAAGDAIGLAFAPDRLHFFDSAGAAIHLHA